jgi:polysaccharide export outer membrane protein
VIAQATSGGQIRFHLINVDDAVVDTLLAQPKVSFRSSFGRYGMPPEAKIAIGDTIAVTIWEAGDGGLFTGSSSDREPNGRRPTPIPDQVVMNDGAISIPFAGRIPVVNRTILQVQRLIEQRLAGKTNSPQVIVTVPKSAANSVTVSGEVVNGARIALSPKGDRLMDMIAAAGGAKAPVYETFVRLSRGGATATIPLERLIADPAENIYAWPEDVLTLVRVPQSFTAFGATGKNAEIDFDAERLTLIQALAKSSGLLDQRADPAGVFLFRIEPSATVAALEHGKAAGGSGPVPVVFRLDLSDAKSYFLAERFPVADQDILYVANASANDLQKFFQLLGTLTSPIVTGIVLQNSVP